jgi:hypothetical protein
MVENPIGIAPRNRECCGSLLMIRQISGQARYRMAEMARAKTNKTTLRTKEPTDIQYSHSALYGRRLRRTDRMPVPIVTENQLQVVSIYCSDLEDRLTKD